MVSGSTPIAPGVLAEYEARRLHYDKALTEGDRAMSPPQHRQMAGYAFRGWTYGMVAAIVAVAIGLTWYGWNVASIFRTETNDPFETLDDTLRVAALTLVLPFILGLAGYLAYIAGYLASWGIPDRLVAGRWELRANAPADLDGLQTAVYAQLVDRDAPIEVNNVYRTHGRREGMRRYTLVSFEDYRASIAFLADDDSVWIGWTLWRRAVPGVLLGHYLATIVRTATGRASLEEQLRYSPARAFRECIHHATRDGLEDYLDRYRPRPPPARPAPDQP